MHAHKMHEHYAKLIKHQDSDFRSRNIRKLIVAHVQQGSVLEVGSGTGHLARELLKQGHPVFATDESAKMIDYTKRTCRGFTKQLTTRVIPGDQISKLTERFDNLISIDVLEHIERDDAAVAQMYHLLNPGGRLVLLVPTLKVLYGIRDQDMGHYRRYGERELLAKLRKAGFKIRKTRYWNILGVLPYFIAERVLKRRVHEGMRYDRTPVKAAINSLLDLWFRVAENPINYHCGLSLLVIAEREPSSRSA